MAEQPRPSGGRRLYRAVVFAVMVGVVGAGMSVIPALFVQSIFIGNAQRCEEVQGFELAADGVITTNCAENLSSTPNWLPITIVAGGGIMGLVGGFGYGFLIPPGASRRREDEEPSWLPF
jgi:hypothetical protein